VDRASARRLLALALAATALAVLSLPAAASAGDLSWIDFISDIKYVEADNSFNNNAVSLARDSATGKLTLTDTGANVTVTNQPGAPANRQCAKLTMTTAECAGPPLGGENIDILLSLGANADSTNYGTSGFSMLVSGESGQDTLHGGTAEDILIGGSENDKLYGAGGPDTFADGVILYAIFGGSPPGDGNDEYHGEEGNDVMLAEQNPGGGVGRDLMDGGPQVDTAQYNERTSPLNLSLNNIADDGQGGELDNLVNIENLEGGAAGDVLSGSAESNTLRGNSADDMLAGGAGADQLYGDSGDDTLNGGPDGDLLMGGNGRDFVSYAAVPGPVSVRYDGVANDGAAGEADNVDASVEVVTGSPAGDTFVGDAAPNNFDAGLGDDQIDGGDGDDTIAGSDGGDAIVAGNGNDGVNAGIGADTVEGGPGDDTIAVRDGEKDSVTCGIGNDTVEADSQDEVFSDCETVNRAAATTADMQPDNGGTGGGGGGGGASAALLRAAIGPARVKVNRRGRGVLLVGCPAMAPAACDAGVTLSTTGRSLLRLARANFKAAPGATRKVRFKLSRKGRARLIKLKRFKASVTVAPVAGAVAPARTKRSVKLVLKRR
jgi:Ca2+-binding RTX toxin-like protein